MFKILVAALLSILGGFLLVAGFITEPIGEIHTSVLKGVGLLMQFSAGWMLFAALKGYAKIQLKKGDTELIITTDGNKDKQTDK